KGSAAMVEKRRKWEEFVAGVSAVLTPPKPEASRG
ncbi:MAG: hypothetical protein QOJ65_1372, partial [Fimbriimonadaceae bacterium]|nr:hypothetical protein [Fimbriimonadaceae bacterium]